jgi:hypothetical protein
MLSFPQGSFLFLMISEDSDPEGYCSCLFGSVDSLACFCSILNESDNSGKIQLQRMIFLDLSDLCKQITRQSLPGSSDQSLISMHLANQETA